MIVPNEHRDALLAQDLFDDSFFELGHEAESEIEDGRDALRSNGTGKVKLEAHIMYVSLSTWMSKQFVHGGKRGRCAKRGIRDT